MSTDFRRVWEQMQRRPFALAVGMRVLERLGYRESTAGEMASKAIREVEDDMDAKDKARRDYEAAEKRVEEAFAEMKAMRGEAAEVARKVAEAAKGFDAPRGWTCPKCNRVYAPHVGACCACNMPGIFHPVSAQEPLPIWYVYPWHYWQPPTITYSCHSTTGGSGSCS